MKTLARGLGIAGVLCLLLISAAGLGIALLDPNDFKPRIIDAVQAATGRTLRLNGPLRISRSLWPTIEVTDVSLDNVPGGSRPDIARAERIEAQLSLPALFRHEIEIVRLTLIGPNILFEQVGGKPNWVLAPNAAPATAPPVAPAAAPAPAASPALVPAASLSLRIRAVSIRNGMVTWRFPARTKVMGIRSLDMHDPVDDGPLDLAAVLVYADNQPVSLRATAQPVAASPGMWSTTIHAAAFDTAATATGTLDVAGTYDLMVEAKAGALEKLNALLPEMQLPPLRNVTLSTHLRNGPALGELPVIGATTLRFDGGDLHERAKGLVLGKTELSLQHAGGTATVAAEGSFAGQPFTLAGGFAVPQRPDGHVSLPVDMTVHATRSKRMGQPAGEGALAFKGELALNALRFGGFDGKLAVQTPALAAFRPVIAPGLPSLTNVRLDGRVSVHADAASIAFKDAKLISDAGEIDGDWTFGLTAGFALEGRLMSPRLDLDALLAALGVALPAAPALGAISSGPVISMAPLPWALLRGPEIKLSTAIAAMTFQGQSWKNVHVAVQLRQGRLDLAPVTLSLPGGQLQLSLAVDASQDAAAVNVEMHAPGIPLALVAHYAGLPGPMQGAVKIDTRLHGAGRTPHEIAASLEGPVSATVIGGRMTNAAFVMLTSASLEALGIKVPAQGETALRCLGLIGAFGKGVGRLQTIALDTTYLQLSGRGQIDFAQETVAFKLAPLAQISGSAVAVPVLVEGPFRAVRGRLDADGLDKLGLFIDGLFGGDRSSACADAGLAPAPPTPRQGG